MGKTGPNLVLNVSSEALRNHSKIARILVLVMTTTGDGANGSYFVREACHSFYVILETKW